jgi:hypothetical protein
MAGPAVTTFTQLPVATALNGTEVLAMVQAGVSVQGTTGQILGLLPFPAIGFTSIPCRVVTANAQSNFLGTDTGLLINKTIAGATTCNLPTPALSKMILVKDMKGDAGTNNITLSAGGGNLINGQNTLVMNANYGTMMLIGMSSSQWGTLI